MEYLKAIGIKFIYISIVIFSLFGIFSDASIANLLMFSVLMTVALFVIGDLIIYPRIGNLFSTLLDFGLALFTAVLLSNYYNVSNLQMILVSLAASFFIMCIEPLFHAYMTERVFNRRVDIFKGRRDPVKITYLHPKHITEFAEEMNVDKIKKRNRKKDHK